MSAVAGWIETHPYLSDLASLHEALEGGGSGAHPRRDPRSAEEIAQGIPLLQSRLLNPTVFVDAGKLIVAMAEVLVDAALPPGLLQESAELCTLLEENPQAGFRLAQSAASSNAPSSLGTFLAWKALGRVLGPSDRTEGWTSSHCPTCGALPAMAQLRQSDRGRERALSCGLCGTRWSYARIGCPFCKNETLEQLGVLEPEDEPGFRIDVCRQCNAYLKTYVGEGGESLALSDWSTLHLDAACSERGLQRGGPSLYAM